MPSGFLTGDRKNLAGSRVSTLSLKSRAQQGMASPAHTIYRLQASGDSAGQSRIPLLSSDIDYKARIPEGFPASRKGYPKQRSIRCLP